MQANNKLKSKFIVLSTSRTGSNWLIDLLNSHPKTRAFEEIFLNQPLEEHLNNTAANLLPPIRFYDFKKYSNIGRPWVTFKYLDMVSKISDKEESIGFKMMYKQMARLPELIAKIILDRYKIIHLIRKNILDVILSRELAKSRALWHSTKKVEQKKVSLDADMLYQVLLKESKQVSKVRLFLNVLPNPVLEVTYEGLRSKTDLTMKRLSTFLKAYDPDALCKSQFRKLNTRHHWDSIENYNEVYAALKGTNFEQLIDKRTNT